MDFARIWTSPFSTSYHPHPYPWCHSALPPGLVYIKIDKAASSTLAGINIRLAQRIGAKVLNGNVCSHTYWHERASSLTRQDKQQHKTKLHRHMKHKVDISLWWTFLRDPGQRALSEYYHFWVSRRGYGINYGIMLGFLKERKNFQCIYTMLHPNPEQVLAVSTMKLDGESSNKSSGSTSLSHSKLLHLLNSHILQQYNFIGLVERWEESLAVMRLLWKISLNDLIVLSAKKSGVYDDGRYNETCFRIKPQGEESDRQVAIHRKIQDYIASDFHHGNLDYDLYIMVNASLDKTIAALGREKVDRTRRQLQFLQSRVELECQNEAIFPCSNNGTRQLEASTKNCYWYDSGCGHACVDRVLEDMPIVDEKS
jgi:hypothetical protein